ncbi:MAG TPA: amino acid adenylation domain-containing protein [Herpetosiphonaceae bacterium]
MHTLDSNSLVALLRQQADHKPHEVLYTFLIDGEDRAASMSYAELELRAQAIAAALQSLGSEPGRAVLLYPPGLDYIGAFFGCLFAGYVAVPLYPPEPDKPFSRFQSVIEDAQATIALTTRSIFELVQSFIADDPALQALHWLVTDDLSLDSAPAWKMPTIKREDLAFLQYTSGSTGRPKGVMLSHNNLLHNLEHIYHCFDHSAESQGVIWLPPYHDMGLIGGILQPLYGGFPVTLMSPRDFLQRPARWLRAISRYRGTTSGGPDFAYELCLRRVSAEVREQLDLSSWRVAFSGAEPVRSSTLRRFAETFAACGFRSSAFYPCYGLAEATLIVAGGTVAKPPVTHTIEREGLAQGRVVTAQREGQELVGNGASLADQTLRIVRPETGAPCADTEIGEIWVSGASVAQGYWNKPEATQATFRAQLRDGDTRPFLRTGDLGYIHAGQLYVTGRLKDLIIVRGRNYYPQDIEQTVEQSHAALRAGRGVAFAIELDGEEKLVVAHEVRSQYTSQAEQIEQTIRQAVMTEHQVQPYDIVLLPAKSIPRTSSGKKQRFACRESYLKQLWTPIRSGLSAEPQPKPAPATGLPIRATLATTNDPQIRREQLLTYLHESAATLLRLRPAQIRRDESLQHFGLDSLQAVEFQHTIETEIGAVVGLTTLLGGSLEAVADEILAGQTPPTPPVQAPGAMPDPAPTSYGQRALWFVQQLDLQSAAYNIYSAVELVSPVDRATLQRALQELVARQAILRTRLVSEGGDLVQRIAPADVIDYRVVDVRSLAAEVVDAQIADEAHRPFNLTDGPLFRARLYQLPEGRQVLLLVVHHIIADFWSLRILSYELGVLYTAALRGEQPGLPALTTHYFDYVNQQTALLSQARGNELWSYWQRQTLALPTLALPLDRPRPAKQSFSGAAHTFAIDAEVVQRLQQIGQAHGVTPYMILLAAFQALLARYTHQSDIVVGSAFAGREHAQFANLVGYFVNPLVMRSRIATSDTFASLLARVRQTVLDGLAHQAFPFPLLVERLKLERDPSRSPVFQTMFTYQKAPALGGVDFTPFALDLPGAQASVGELAIRSHPVAARTAQFDLTLTMAEWQSTLHGRFQYNSDLFNHDTIERMAGHLSTLLRIALEQPDAPLAQLPLLTPAEFDDVIVRRNQTDLDIPSLAFPALVTQQAARTPRAPALRFGDQICSYAELEARTNQLAHLLRARGARAGTTIAVYLNRSLEMPIVLLAIFKAGAAFVPLDPAFPEERLRFVLGDAGAQLILTQQALRERLPAGSIAVLAIDALADELADYPTTPLPEPVIPEHLAYIMYTSGSTGRPKGVMISHHNLMNYLGWCVDAYGAANGNGAPVQSSIAADAIFPSLFAPLLAGTCVHIMPETRPLEALAAAFAERSPLSLVKITPTQLEVLGSFLAADAEPAGWVTTLVVGAEAVRAEGLSFWRERAPATRILNEYGPTETTVGCSLFRVPPEFPSVGAVPMGLPSANTQFYVLDAQLQPVPVGVPGELFIGGESLAWGYLNRPDLTAEKFLPDPFRPLPGARMYRTGDLVHLLPDPEANLIFVGRIDDQVKIRGYRVEPDEIATVLAEAPGVAESVVLVREDTPGSQRLVAYVVRHAGAEVQVDQLRAHAQMHLPDYMVPAGYVVLDRWPLTTTGKIDRRSLPSPQYQAATGTFVAPSGKIEQQIAEIWKQVLGVEQVSVYDNFFDLGGHSLLLARVQARLSEQLGQPVALTTLFERPTIRDIAQFLVAGDEQRVKPTEEARSRAQQQRAARRRRTGGVEKE